MTPEVLGHVTVGGSCDQTGSKSSRDQAPKQVLTLLDKESGDKECEHVLMHAVKTHCYTHSGVLY